MGAGEDQIIIELVRERRLAEPEALGAALSAAREAGQSLAEVLVARRVVDQAALLAAVADFGEGEFAGALPATLSDETVRLFDAGLARSFGVVPLGESNGTVKVAARDPLRADLAEELRFALGRAVRLVIADPAEVDALFQRYYGGGSPPLIDTVEETPPPVGTTSAENISEADLEQMAGQTPIIRFVNRVLGQAIRDRASDIHFEPFEDSFKIRYRIDGALRDVTPPAKALALPIVSRLKVLANLNIAERRLPQDGRIRLRLGGRPVDLRVSTLPTQFGESVVLRVLDQSAIQLELGQLGLPASVEAGLRTAIARPNGIVLVTGPTGSGKTTTLYSCLKILNANETKLLTVEDPVEYEIDGIMQVPVNPAADLGFARAVRAFLRQDPDIVMVGEIRDLETARIGIQAALTGHLVLSTLHTNDAPGAVSRLVDMGVEPFLLASTIEAVVAQRLVRCVCAQCKTADQPSPDWLRQFGIEPEQAKAATFARGTGCAACHHSGYAGRTGIYELLQMTDPLRELIIARAPLDELAREAQKTGLVPLREAGLALAFAGNTTLEELGRHI
jgi:type IV pilus assembly protein PilB